MSWSQRYPQLNSADLHHRLSRIITCGKVAEVDYQTARVKVTMGEWTTTWLPWVTSRASNNIDWNAPEIDEQVIILSPSGDIAQGVVIGSVYQGEQTEFISDIAAQSRSNVHRIKYQDGTTIEYDRENHRLKADVQGDVEIAITKNLTATVQQNADVTITQNLTATVQENATLTVQGDLTADVSKDCTINAKNLTLATSGDMTLRAGGTMKLNASQIKAQE